jgi:hypothetical protein
MSEQNETLSFDEEKRASPPDPPVIGYQDDTGVTREEPVCPSCPLHLSRASIDWYPSAHF